MADLKFYHLSHLNRSNRVSFLLWSDLALLRVWANLHIFPFYLVPLLLLSSPRISYLFHWSPRLTFIRAGASKMWRSDALCELLAFKWLQR